MSFCVIIILFAETPCCGKEKKQVALPPLAIFPCAPDRTRTYTTGVTRS